MMFRTFYVILVLCCNGYAESKFTCPNSTNLIQIEDDQLCNGVNNCFDELASDECNCSTTLRNVCMNGRCILERNICDSVDDCQDGCDSDEKNCNETTTGERTPTKQPVMKPFQFNCSNPLAVLCADGKTCAHPGRFCDGTYDCPDHSDEFFAGPGLKCYLRQTLGTACVLPQVNIFSHSPKCGNEADLCFDKNGNLTSACFQCLDGNHIISKLQTCDGVLDCMDFSDECLCNDVNTPEVCTVYSSNLSCNTTIYADSSNEIRNKWINGTISCGEETCVSTAFVCDGVEDCPNGVDEKYCVSPSVQRVMKNMAFEKLPLDNNTSDLYDSALFQNDSVRCRNGKWGWIIARACDGHTFCEKLDDECKPECKNPPPYCKIDMSCLDGLKICNGRWDSDHVCPNGRILEEEMGCPNRFYCKSGKRISVRNDQVCDGIVNCDDASDENEDQGCQDSRFYCETFENQRISVENPLFVSRSQLFDGKKNCADGTDECPSFYNEDSFSWRNEMISKLSLKSVLWIIAPFAFFGNVAVLVTTVHTLKTVKLNAIAVVHRYLVANLAAADGLMGIYLVILAIVSTAYSGTFCLASRTWKTSLLCNIMGTLVIISSQASVFILMLMGLFRLYTIIRPFEAQFSLTTCKHFYSIGLFVAWFLAVFLAVIPWCFDYFITSYHFGSLFFQTDQVGKSDYQNFLAKINAIAQTNNVEENSTIVVRRNFSDNGVIQYQKFTSRRIPDVDYSGSFGFYSQNSICLPSYFARSDMPGWQYSIGIITLNFSMFIFMAIVYMLIAYYGNPFRHPALRAMSKQCMSKGKFNFQKCKLHHRVARLILTDFLCWIPLCVLSYTYFAGVDYDKFVIAVCGIILLPINSALNPILYSALFDSFLAKIKRFFGKKNFLRSFSLSTQKFTFKSSTSSHLHQARKSSSDSANENASL